MTSLKLFVANKNAKFLCNVPCCFHLLTEFNCPAKARKNLFRDDFWEPEENALEQNPSFPISAFMKDFVHRTGFKLGRNSRMVCSYSLSRMCNQEKVIILILNRFYGIRP